MLKGELDVFVEVIKETVLFSHLMQGQKSVKHDGDKQEILSSGAMKRSSPTQEELLSWQIKEKVKGGGQ